MKRTNALETKKLKTLARKWNKRLADEGLSPISDSTPWSFSGKSSVVIVQANKVGPDHKIFDCSDYLCSTDESGNPLTVSQTAQGETWRHVGRAVHDLPNSDPNKAFLVAWSKDGNESAALREFGLSRVQGKAVVIAFCRAQGIPTEDLYRSAYPQTTSDRDPKSGLRYKDPCGANPKKGVVCKCGATRNLSKREIKQLPYTPPPKKAD